MEAYHIPESVLWSSYRVRVPTQFLPISSFGGESLVGTSKWHWEYTCRSYHMLNFKVMNLTVNMVTPIRVATVYPTTAFKLACRSPHCHFDSDFCTPAQASLATEERPSGEQRQANQSITSPLCPQRQIADTWLLFNLRATSLDEKATAAWPMRAATLKWQAVIRRCSGNVVSSRLVWSQLYKYINLQ